MSGDAHSSSSSFRKNLEEEKKVRVYYVCSQDSEGTPIYCYAVVSALLHDKFLAALEYGQVPDFAVVVEMGKGEPTQAVKDKMKQYYNFDHDLHVANSNVPPEDTAG